MPIRSAYKGEKMNAYIHSVKRQWMSAPALSPLYAKREFRLEQNFHTMEKIWMFHPFFSALYAERGCRLWKICIRCRKFLDYLRSLLKKFFNQMNAETYCSA